MRPRRFVNTTSISLQQRSLNNTPTYYLTDCNKFLNSRIGYLRRLRLFHNEHFQDRVTQHEQIER